MRRHLAVAAVAAVAAVVAVAGAIAVCPATAAAKDWKLVAVWNGTGQAASGLELSFRGAGSRLALLSPVVVFPQTGGCEAPATATTRQKAPDGDHYTALSVTWGAACVQPGAVVWFDVAAARGPLILDGGVWTSPAGDTLGTVRTGDVRVSELPVRPVTPRPLLYALGILVAVDALCLGVLLIRRRKRAAARP